jgi:hypothetical protein
MLVRRSVGPSVGPLEGPHITLKTDYVAIALRRGEGRGNQLMSKTGYIEIALRLLTVARSCFYFFFLHLFVTFTFLFLNRFNYLQSLREVALRPENVPAFDARFDIPVLNRICYLH